LSGLHLLPYREKGSTLGDPLGFNLQLLFTGIGVGSALVALGFVLIYRATNAVNFAQGDFAMLGAFAMVVLAIDLELPYWLSILITVMLLLGFGSCPDWAHLVEILRCTRRPFLERNAENICSF
jgi:branched-subunit amino acid ABC-type transport system permease component